MAAKTYSNRNFLGKDGIIYNCYIGNQNAATVKQTEVELQKLVAQVREKKGAVLVLSDISRIDKIQLSARHAGYRLIHNLDFDKAAIYGNHIRFKGIVEAVVLASGCVFKIKLFNSLEQAKNWLLNN